MSRKIACSMLTVCALAGAAFAQTTQPESADAKEAKAAAKTFIKALAGDDETAIKEQFAGTDEDYKLVSAMHDMIKSGKHLKTAAEARWPDEMKKAGNSDDMNPDKMAERLDKETVTVSGDTATFANGGAMLKKVDGKWKVTDLVGASAAKPMLTKMMPTMAKIADDTAKEVEDGKYTSFADTTKALQAKMMASMRPTMTATPMPSTRPAK